MAQSPFRSLLRRLARGFRRRAAFLELGWGDVGHSPPRPRRPRSARRQSNDAFPWAALGVLVAALALSWVILQGAQWLGNRHSFAYAAKLLDGGAPVESKCDFLFGLFDKEFAGQRIGKLHERTLEVQKGVFQTRLDFGADPVILQKFFVDVEVRCPTGRGNFTRLLRQRLASGRTFEMQGLARLARELLHEAPGQTPTPVPSPDTGTQTEVAAAGDQGPVAEVGFRARDTVQGHDGVKRAETQVIAEQPSAEPGQKRLDGTKGEGRSWNRNRLRNVEDAPKDGS